MTELECSVEFGATLERAALSAARKAVKDAIPGDPVIGFDFEDEELWLLFDRMGSDRHFCPSLADWREFQHTQASVHTAHGMRVYFIKVRSQEFWDWLAGRENTAEARREFLRWLRSRDREERTK